MKNKIISTAIIVIVGLGSFYSGIYYGTLKLDQFVDKLSIGYDSIKKDVDAFIEVSNPETIRRYIEELDKILTDIKFLDVLIESGQITDESIGDVFIDTESKLNALNEKLLLLSTDTQDMISDVKGEVTAELNNNKVELDNTLNEFKSETDLVKQRIERLYNKLDELYVELNKVTVLLDKAEGTFVGKYVFKKQ
jgi:gas vesicle protein